jgi:hypothetical protein
MPTKMMSPNTTIWFVKATHTTAPTFVASAPDASQLAADLVSGAAINLSEAIATGYTLGATASDTDDSKTIVDEANSQSRGNGNYEAELPFYLEDDVATNTTSPFEIAYQLFKDGRVAGTLVKRQGYKYTVAPAAGQDVSTFSVLSIEPRVTESDAGGPISFVVPFMAQGYMLVNEALVA